MDSRARQLIQIGDSLFSKKLQWDQLCQEIAENFFPMRADFTRSFTLGEDFSEDLMESFPVQARETLGNLPSAMLRQGDWFEVKTGFEETDENAENARWFQSATKRFRRLIYDRRANFVKATTEADHDYVTFGNPVLSVEESPDRDHFLFRSWHPKECAWMENAVGKIDHIQRRMPMTARTIVKRWRKTAHADIIVAAERDPTAEFKVRHIVLPTEEVHGDDRKAMRRFNGMPFVSMYIDCDHEVVLGEGPLPVFNYIVPRWRTVSNFQYGFSPAAVNALPDGRMIQSLAHIILEQGEKALDPSHIAKGEIFRDAVNFYAGGMTYVDLEADEKLQDVFQTIQTGSGLPAGLELKQDVRNLIAEAFLINKLTMPDLRDVRELGVQAYLDNFRRTALPFFGPIESEYHLPLLDAAFQIAVRNRAFNFKDMPEALQGEDVTFTFESPLNTAEGRKNVVAFQESMQLIAGVSQFDKSIPTTMDFKQMTKDAVKGTGAPADWFVDSEVQQSNEDAAQSSDELQAAALALREGAGVATDVATATKALQESGLA